MNTINVNFIPCSPAPANGYKLTWRVAGTEDAYNDEGSFFSSPASFIDEVNPEGTCYEGFLQSDCTESGESGSLLGDPIPWATPCAESASHTIQLASPCSGINSAYVIQEGTAGDVLTVRATFIGLIQKNSNLFTRADVIISSPDGTSDSTSSPCYTDTSSHPFSITADTIITMTGPTTYVNLAAVTHNSSSSMSSVNVEIIEINGSPVSISTSGCKGDSSTGGTC